MNSTRRDGGGGRGVRTGHDLPPHVPQALYGGSVGREARRDRRVSGEFRCRRAGARCMHVPCV